MAITSPKVNARNFAKIAAIRRMHLRTTMAKPEEMLNTKNASSSKASPLSRRKYFALKRKRNSSSLAQKGILMQVSFVQFGN